MSFLFYFIFGVFLELEGFVCFVVLVVVVVWSYPSDRSVEVVIDGLSSVCSILLTTRIGEGVVVSVSP